jgi:alanine racemase
MMPSAHVTVEIDLGRVRANVSAIRAKTGKQVIAVVKADAYGLGGERVAHAIADLVESFYAFDLAELDAYKLADTKRPTIVLSAIRTTHRTTSLATRVPSCGPSIAPRPSVRRDQSSP